MESKGVVDRKEKKKKSKGRPKAPPEPLREAPNPEPKVPETQDVKMRSKKVSRPRSLSPRTINFPVKFTNL